MKIEKNVVKKGEKKGNEHGSKQPGVENLMKRRFQGEKASSPRKKRVSQRKKKNIPKKCQEKNSIKTSLRKGEHRVNGERGVEA